MHWVKPTSLGSAEGFQVGFKVKPADYFSNQNNTIKVKVHEHQG